MPKDAINIHFNQMRYYKQTQNLFFQTIYTQEMQSKQSLYFSLNKFTYYQKKITNKLEIHSLNQNILFIYKNQHFLLKNK